VILALVLQFCSPQIRPFPDFAIFLLRYNTSNAKLPPFRKEHDQQKKLKKWMFSNYHQYHPVALFAPDNNFRPNEATQSQTVVSINGTEYRRKDEPKKTGRKLVVLE